MRIAVISDIHGNLEAFESVLLDIEKQQPDRVYCLGDNIGYGPDPEAVVRKLREKNIVSIMGNHEWAVSNLSNLNWFNPMAKRSLEWTIGELSEEAVRYIKSLEQVLLVDDMRMVHGFPPDSVNTYLFQVSEVGLRHMFREMEERICFVGHTHVLEVVRYSDDEVERIQGCKGEMSLETEGKYLINVGSVGQPRDENNHAKYVIFDSEKNRLIVRYVPYDIGKVAEKILEAGLPHSHAARLW